MFTCSVEEKVELSVEISKPVGAVRVTGPERPLPLTVKDWAAEALTCGAEKPVRLVTEGESTPLTRPERETDLVAAFALASVMLPEVEPTGAEAAMRA